ncbi:MULTISPECIES: hypothetical protein [Streptomyces]|uniref:hypothetical protein n=1 Tax=Streptomyces TaxID=1883 RepID=UPI003427FFD1
MTISELKAVCDGCKTIVGSDEGALWISHQAVREREAAVRSWQARNEAKAPPGQVPVHNYQELMDCPDAVRWAVHHNACSPAGFDSGYHVPVQQLRTWADLTAWTAHLMAKGWLPATDWAQLLESAARGSGTRITPVSPPQVSF